MKRTLTFFAPICFATTAHADYPTTIIDAGPLAYYRFEEAAGATAIADSSGNGNDTEDFSATIGTSALGESGAVGLAALFNGDGSILTPLLLDPSVGNFSVEVLINPAVPAGQTGVFVSNQDGAGLGRSNLIFDGAGVIRSFLGGSSTVSQNDAPAGEWYHVILTYDEGAVAGGVDPTLRFYVDGEATGSSTSVAEFADGGWVLGSHKSQTSQFYTGLLDEASIYDYRLDDPDGDGDDADSRVGTHYKAYIGDSDVLLSFASDTSFIDAGGSATLSWSVSPTLTALTLDDGGGPVDVLAETEDCEGSTIVMPAATATYTLSGTSPVGTEELELTINVAAPPVVDSFASDRSEVGAGGTARLSWVVTNAVTVTIDNGVGDVDPPSGSVDVTVAADTTYTLTATNANGEVTAEVTITTTDSDPSLIAHWRVGEAPGETAGTTLVAETGELFDGTFVGTPAWDTEDAAPTPDGSTACIVFDGLNSWVDITAWNGIGGPQARTVAFWFKGPAQQPNQHGTIVSWGPNSTTNRFDTRVSANGRNGTMRSEVSGSGRDSSLFIADDTWHHAAVVIVDDGSPNIGEALFYVDGVLDEAAVGGTTDINTAATVNARIGASRTLGGRSLTGKVDDIRIYDRALTGEEIVDLIEGSPDPLRITSVVRNPDGSVTLEWNAQPNTFYSVDYSFDLGAWLELTDGLDTGEVTDVTNAPGADEIFYRVREEG